MQKTLKMKHLSEEQIWEVIDGIAEPEVLVQHEKLMQVDESYQREFQKSAFLQTQLLKLDLDMPSMRFTENVMERVLPHPKTQASADRSPYFFLTIMVILGAITVSLMNISDSAASQGVNTEGVTSALFNPLFLNIFLLTNTVLFFVILDKKILKPYFLKRLSKQS